MLWRKSKFKRILELVEKLSKDVSNFKSTLCDLEDFKEDQKDVEDKENKLILALEAENKLLRERLLQKDIFVENLLAQLLGGANIAQLLNKPSVEPKKEETKYTATMSAREKYLAEKKKNGGLPLPG